MALLTKIWNDQPFVILLVGALAFYGIKKLGPKPDDGNDFPKSHSQSKSEDVSSEDNQEDEISSIEEAPPVKQNPKNGKASKKAAK